MYTTTHFPGLVHNSLMKHEIFRDGTKYILRSDVMYTKCDDTIMTENEEKGLQLLQEAERLEVRYSNISNNLIVFNAVSVKYIKKTMTFVNKGWRI